MKKALITGLNGFVGSALSQKLIGNGWKVRGTVRNNKNSRFDLKNIETFPTGSIDEYNGWDSILDGIDVVVHLAAHVHQMSPARDKNDLGKYRRVNITATERLFLKAAENNVKRFIFVSSIKVNGEGSATPYKESDPPAPEDPYAKSKLEAEKRLTVLSSNTGLDLVILRPPLIYGPNVKANFIKLMVMVYRGVPLPFKNLKNKRSLIYLYNFIDCIITCMQHPEAAGETFNAKDKKSVSTPELVKAIAKVMQKRTVLIPFPLFLLRLISILSGKKKRFDKITGTLVVDSSKISKQLGWNPPYSFQRGIEETVRWYLNSL